MKILHVFRAPVGGLFRHVRDLATQQAKAGHDVAIICDSLTGNAMADAALKTMHQQAGISIQRLPIPRLPGVHDLAAQRKIRTLAHTHAPQIVHGHGAKGGLHARLAARSLGAKAIYTAHGGSLHYSWKSPHGAIFLGVERLLLKRTDGLIFVCDYEKRTFDEKLGIRGCPSTVIHNGLSPGEFTIQHPLPDARDLLFIGELRMLKGVDVLLNAMALLRAQGRPLSAMIVGHGPDRNSFVTQAEKLGLPDVIEFPGAMPAAKAFPMGRIMIVPSRAESFPYVVLEAQAAGKPVIASDVGGIGEMLPREMLVPPDDAEALAGLIARTMDDPQMQARAIERMKQLKTRFSIATMADRALAFYESLIGA